MTSMPERHPHILRREDTALVVIDMQEPFLNVMHDRERLISNVRLLVQAAIVMQIPVLPTTQNAKRLGQVAAEITQDYKDFSVAASQDKMAFSCVEADGFLGGLTALGRHQIVLCGLETHICVSQTALDLVHLGYQVHMAADAVSSRSLEKHTLGMERMRDCGILPCAAEAAVYEWLHEAGTPAFKAILPLVK